MFRSRPRSIPIDIDNSDCIMEAIINEIDGIETMREVELRYNELPDAVRISELKEFYNLNNFSVDDYKLYAVNIYGGACLFLFATVETFYSERCNVNCSSSIRLQIARKDIYEYYDWYMTIKRDNRLAEPRRLLLKRLN